MTKASSDLTDISRQLDGFLHENEALTLATVNDQGEPEASYAAYVEHNGSFYIFVSELASHTQNLMRRAMAGVMFLEREADAGHAYTRKRLTCSCRATRIERNDPLFDSVLQQLEQQFGSLIKTLRGLRDFHLFQLKPEKGQFVAGFGKAYEIDYSEDKGIKHRNPA